AFRAPAKPCRGDQRRTTSALAFPPAREPSRARADTPRLRRAAQELERIEQAAGDWAVVDLAFAADADAEREPAHDDPARDESFVVRFAGEFRRRKPVDRDRGLTQGPKTALVQG